MTPAGAGCGIGERGHTAHAAKAAATRTASAGRRIQVLIRDGVAGGCTSARVPVASTGAVSSPDASPSAVSGFSSVSASGMTGAITSAIKRYPDPVMVWMNRGASESSRRACRIFRMAPLMLLSVSRKTSFPQILSAMLSRAVAPFAQPATAEFPSGCARA
jgi:hypothetical protein